MRWFLIGFVLLGCASGGSSAAERQVGELTGRLAAERDECGARTATLEAELAEERKTRLSLSHSLLDKAEAVVILKLQAIEFQRRVSELADLPLADDLVEMKHGLRAQLSEIDNMRRNLPPRPIDSFNRQEEELLIRARDAVDQAR